MEIKSSATQGSEVKSKGIPKGSIPLAGCRGGAPAGFGQSPREGESKEPQVPWQGAGAAPLPGLGRAQRNPRNLARPNPRNLRGKSIFYERSLLRVNEGAPLTCGVPRRRRGENRRIFARAGGEQPPKHPRTANPPGQRIIFPSEPGDSVSLK